MKDTQQLEKQTEFLRFFAKSFLMKLALIYW